MDTLAEKARSRNQDRLSQEEIEALARRQIPYQTAVQLVQEEMQCAQTTFYKHYKHLLKPFSLVEAGPRFCWEDEVLRAIAAVKGAAPSPSPTPPSPLEKPA